VVNPVTIRVIHKSCVWIFYLRRKTAAPAKSAWLPVRHVGRVYKWQWAVASTLEDIQQWYLDARATPGELARSECYENSWPRELSKLLRVNFCYLGWEQLNWSKQRDGRVRHLWTRASEFKRDCSTVKSSIRYCLPSHGKIRDFLLRGLVSNTRNRIANSIRHDPVYILKRSLLS